MTVARWRLQVIADRQIGPRLRGSLQAEQSQMERNRAELTR